MRTQRNIKFLLLTLLQNDTCPAAYPEMMYPQLSAQTDRGTDRLARTTQRPGAAAISREGCILSQVHK
jgi:hypothetical protein